MTKKLNIIFMGTPDFAARSLEQIVEDGFNVVGVITATDKKKGRGQNISESAVKTSAQKLNIPVFQPTNLKDDSFQNEIRKLNPDLGVVVAFRMLPESIWNMPDLGTINLHASLLPNYRGAAPINWAIINGEKESGITTFFLKHEIDTGDVILQEKVPITKDMDAGTLHDILMINGAKLLSRSIELIEKGKYQRIDQSTMAEKGLEINKAPKIFKEDCEIKWDRTSIEIHNFIRGLSPYPGAWCKLLINQSKELIFKVYKSAITDIDSRGKAGSLQVKDNERLLVGTSDRFIDLIEVQLEGKKRLKVSEFLKGISLSDASILK